MNLIAIQRKSLTQRRRDAEEIGKTLRSLRLCVRLFVFVIATTLAFQLPVISQLHAQSTTSKLQSRPFYQEIQLALDKLTRAEIAQEEVSLAAALNQNFNQDFNKARQQCRDAIAKLRTLEIQLTELLRKTYQQKPSSLTKNSWTAQELESLARNLKVQLARAYRNQALCYSTHSPDQVNSLSLALQQLESIINLPLDEPLVWQARIEQVVCLRLLKKTAQSRQQIAHWQQKKPPGPFASRLFGELLKVNLAEGELSQALAKIDSQKDRPQAAPETDDAILETLLAAQRIQPALQQFHHIKATHSPFWKHRAELRLGRAFAEQTDTDDPELLAYAAASLYNTGKLSAAVTTYDRIAALLAAENKLDRQFQTANTTAAIVRKMNQPQAALDRYRQLALDHPQHPEASTAHWIAVGLAAELSRAATLDQRGITFEQYLALLTEHLKKWPAQPTAKTARQWLARTQHPEIDRQRAKTLAATGQRQAALEIYRKLLKEAPDEADLLEAYAQLLTQETAKTELREALQVWQQIEKRSKPGGLRWSRARRARLVLLEQLGEGGQAKKLRQLTEILYE